MLLGKRDRDQQDRYTREMYRQVLLGNENGRVVLTFLMQTCGLLKEIKTDEQRTLHNWGVALLENMGMAKDSEVYARMIESLARMGGNDGRS